MTRTLTLVCFMLVLCSGGLAGSQDLPPEVLADLYLLEATTALENGEPQQAIRTIEKIEALDTELPLEFFFFYGKLLVEHGTGVNDWRKGQALLKLFILNIEKDADQYVPTLKLLSASRKRIEKAERKMEAEAEAKRQQRAAAVAAGQRLKIPSPLVEMVRVQGGTFMMGCTEEQSNCYDREKPVHRVQVPDFEISKLEVTQRLWEAVMGENRSVSNDCGWCPVDSVSWKDIQIFLEKLNTLLPGDRYRLPTEAEWEYAARGGQQSRGYEYAGSDTPDLVAWYEELSSHSVGKKAANELGLFDMSGNVWEWVADCWNSSYRGAPSDGSAWTRGDCRQRVVRGGSWDSKPRDLRSVSRDKNKTDWRDSDNILDALMFIDVGFRLARTLTP